VVITCESWSIPGPIAAACKPNRVTWHLASLVPSFEMLLFLLVIFFYPSLTHTRLQMHHLWSCAHSFFTYSPFFVCFWFSFGNDKPAGIIFRIFSQTCYQAGAKLASGLQQKQKTASSQQKCNDLVPIPRLVSLPV